MNVTKITIRVVTAAGTNASAIGESYGAYDGVAWRNSADACDSDGNGRVFLDCDSEETAEFVIGQFADDERVSTYYLDRN